MWKSVGIAVGVIAVAALSLVGYAVATGLRSPHPVGFQIVSVADPNGPPLQVGIWYPTKARAWPTLTGMIVQWVAGDAPVDGTKRPLIIISHGIAGALMSHADTALALANAGFVVAAPLHTGDNSRDQRAIGTRDWFPDRARHVHITINYLLDEWRDRSHIDADKIGIFGFSAGGTTALIAVGGTPDLSLVESHCARTAEFACQVWRSKKATAPDTSDFLHDPRIKAAVVIAPGAGFAFADYGLSGVRVPVQLWGGEKDESVPTASNAEVVHHELGTRAEWHLVPNAGHFSFMVPCGLAGLIAPKMLCSERPGFDRAHFHKTFNAAVVGFLRQKLAAAPRFVCTNAAVDICVSLTYMNAIDVGTMVGSFDLFGNRKPRGPIAIPNGPLIAVTIPDFIPELSRKDLTPVCTARACIYYRKWCSPEASACSYVLSAPIRNDFDRDKQRIIWGEAFLVYAPSEASLRRTEAAITLGGYIERQGSPEFIPLRRLDHAAANLDVASCDVDKQTAGCQPPLKR
jgi:predicted dienelactone hydrolase